MQFYTVYEKEKHQHMPEYNKNPIKESSTEFRKVWYD